MKKEILTNTPEQAKLRTELCEAYSIEPEEVIFFGDDPKPLLKYEACCTLINALIPEMKDIRIQPVVAISSDAVSVECHLTLPNGNRRSGFGVANSGETNEKAELLTDEQLQQLASSRAIRNALRVGGIDLIKLHRGAAFEKFSGDSDHAIMSRHAHALGTELGFIAGKDKSAWESVLIARYSVRSTKDLDDRELADFIAFLTAVKIPSLKKAA